MTSVVKVCGLSSVEAVKTCANYKNIIYNGFIAYPNSPRYVTPSAFKKVSFSVSSDVKKVLVVVNETDDVIESYFEAGRVDVIQCHGDESPARCLKLREKFSVDIFKACAVETKNDLLICKSYYEYVDMLLLDTKKSDGTSGGSGKVFNWDILLDFSPPIPFFLSGGLSKDNIADAYHKKITSHFDVSSMLETEKGIKDTLKIKDFMNLLNSLD